MVVDRAGNETPRSFGVPVDTEAAEVFARAEAARDAGELTEAERLLREGLAARKGDVQLSNLLAIVLHARGKRVESVALLREIVRANPLASVPRWNLALALEAATLKAEARRQFATYLNKWLIGIKFTVMLHDTMRYAKD